MKRIAMAALVCVATFGCTHGTASVVPNDSAPRPNSPVLKSADQSNGRIPAFLVSFPFADEVGVVDPASGQMSELLLIKGSPGEIAINPVRPTAYVMVAISQGPSEAAVIELGADTGRGIAVSTYVQMPPSYHNLTVGGGGDEIFGVSNGQIDVISAKSGALLRTYSYSSAVASIALANNRLFASLPAIDEVLAIDPASGDVIHTIVGPPCTLSKACHPDRLSASPGGKYIIGVAATREIDVVWYDTSTYKRVGRAVLQGSGGCRVDGQGLIPIGIDAAADEIWFKHGCKVLPGQVAVVTSTNPPPQDGLPIHDSSRRIGESIGGVAFDNLGQTGYIEFFGRPFTGLAPVAGPNGQIPTESPATAISFSTP